MLPQAKTADLKKTTTGAISPTCLSLMKVFKENGTVDMKVDAHRIATSQIRAGEKSAKKRAGSEVAISSV